MLIFIKRLEIIKGVNSEKLIPFILLQYCKIGLLKCKSDEWTKKYYKYKIIVEYK